MLQSDIPCRDSRTQRHEVFYPGSHCPEANSPKSYISDWIAHRSTSVRVVTRGMPLPGFLGKGGTNAGGGRAPWIALCRAREPLKSICFSTSQSLSRSTSLSLHAMVLLLYPKGIPRWPRFPSPLGIAS
jgi:hypothetical protein